MTSFRGVGTEPLNDFLFKAASGKIPGHTVGTMFGRNLDLDPSAKTLIWDFGSIQTREVYLTANTELFLSSESVSDTNVIVVLTGLTDDYVFKTQTFTFTSGQSQQSVGSWFRASNITVIGGDAPLGNMYVAESGPLTLGVPDDPAKVHDYMIAGENRSHKSACTVPVNNTVYITRLFLATRKNEDALFTFVIKGENHPAFIEVSDFPVYQNTIFESFSPPFPVTEKTDFEFIASTATNNSQVVANVGYVMVDNSISDL